MKRSRKTLSILLMFMMVVTTLVPTWAFGTEAAAEETNSSAVQETTSADESSSKTQEATSADSGSSAAQKSAAAQKSSSASQSNAEKTTGDAAEYFAEITAEGIGTDKAQDKPYLEAGIVKQQKDKTVSVKKDTLTKKDEKSYQAKQNLNDKKTIGYSGGNAYGITLKNYYDDKGNARDAYQLNYININGYKVKIADVEAAKNHDLQIANGKISGFSGDADVFLDPENGRDLTIAFSGDAEFSKDLSISFVFAQDSAKTDSNDSAKSDAETESAEQPQAVDSSAVSDELKTKAAANAVTLAANVLTAGLTGNDESNHDNQVHVIVENTTYTKDAGAAWEGTLVDTWVDLEENATVMSCIVAALNSISAECVGADTGYISSINGLAAEGMAGWMGTLNDWFTNEGFSQYSLAAGNLKAGDEIRIMYTLNGGEDLGGSWSNNDKTVKNIVTSAGTLSPAFDKDTHEYTLTVPKGTESITVTPTASNKNFQVRTFIGTTEYGRSDQIPVSDGTKITVKCGDPSWPSMNGGEYGTADSVAAEEYTLTVETAKTVKASVSTSFQQANSYLMTPQALEVESNLAESYGYTDSVDSEKSVSALDVLVRLHEVMLGDAFTKDTKDDYLVVNSGTISKVMGENTYSVSFAINGAYPYDPTSEYTTYGYTGYMINQAPVADGDSMDLFFYQDSYYMDYYTWFEQNGAKVSSVNAAKDEKITLNLQGVMYAYCGALTKEDAVKQGGWGAIADAQLTLVDAKTGKTENIEDAVTDKDGNATISFSKAGTYYVSAYSSSESTYITSPWIKVSVDTAPVLKDGVAAELSASVTKNAAYTLDLDTIFEDPQGDELTYAVSVDGAEEVTADADYSVTYDANGTHKLVFRAYDGESWSTAYTVNLTVENEKIKLESLIVHSGFSPTNTSVLIKNESDTYTSGQTFDSETTEYTISGQTDSLTDLRFRAKAADSDAKVMLYYGDNQSKDITWTKGSSKYVKCLSVGKNTLTIKTVPADGSDKEGTAYTISIDCVPTLTGITAKSGDTEFYLDKTFSATENEYTLTIPEKTETLDLTAVPKGSGYTVTYNGGADSAVNVKDKDKVEITVAAGEGENRLENTYTLNLKRAEQLDFKVDATPKDAIVKVYDSEGAEVKANEDGSFSGMFSASEYTYVVTKYGYVAQTGKVPAAGGKLEVTLEKAADDGLNDVSSDWSNFRGSDTNMGITDTETPISKEDTALLWNAKLGSGWSAAPSVQIIVDDALIVMSGTKIYKLDLKTGETLKTGTMSTSPSYGYTPPTYAEGMIFCPLGNGTVQAFNAETLESLWIYKDPLKGQALSPITYSDGYIYTGFWNSETKTADYVCISVTDEDVTKTDETKQATWMHRQAGGYYWAGSVSVGNYIIVGTDDGTSGTAGDSVLTAYNKTTGEAVSSLTLTGAGDQRSSIAYDKENGKVYFTTKGGYLCSAKIDEKTGTLSGLKMVSYNAQSTSTPIVYKGVVYFATGSGITSSGSSGNFVAADADTLEMKYAVGLKGYPQCSMLMSTAYEDEGYLYFYSTYNANPGGISMIKVKNGAQTKDDTELIELYDAAGFANYCISSIICDKNGNLYYKNDSGNVFAVGVPSYTTVKNLIDKIGDVTLDSKMAIDTARKAYDALSDENKEKVTNYDKLVAAEKKLNELEIENVEKLIDDIGTVTLDKESKINAAKEAYDALTDSQKEQISNYDVLKKAIDKLAELKKAAEAAEKENKGTADSITPSGTTLAASGTTRSITKTANIKLANMTTAAKAALSKIDAVVNAGLPSSAKDYTDSQIKQIVNAYKAYNALSVSEKKAVEATDSWTKFTEITQKLASMYHYDKESGIDVRATSAENLPWYIKLVVTQKTITEKQQTKVKNVLGDDSEMFNLCDITFINTLDNSEWHPSGLIRVKMPMVDIGSYNTPVIVHIADNGSIKLVEGQLDSEAGTIEFEASDFSLYGIAGSNESIDSLLGAQTASNVLPWIIAGAIAAAALIVIIIAKKRKGKGEINE